MDNQSAMGLGSLRQHGVAIPSETKNIEYFFNLAKKMSDGQLADILSGKSLDIPQFVAMTEAMGRKELRQAAEGAQAQQALKEPSIKDRLVAEDAARRMPMQMAGIDQLPANNMRTLAGGGIIAFEDGGEVQHFYNQGAVNADDEAIASITDPEYARKKRQSDAWARLADNKTPYSVEQFRSDVVDPFKSFFTSPWDKASAADAEKAAITKLMQEKNISAEEAAQQVRRGVPLPTSDETRAFTGAGNTASTNTNASPNANNNTTPSSGAPTSGNKGTPTSGLPAINVAQPTTFERRANPFAQMSADAVDEVGIKDRGLGFGLMKLASHVVSTPGTKGFGEGINALADQGLLTQKELKDAKKDARDYNFNITKAYEAAEQGNDELALKYKTLAEQTDYHKTMGKAAMITAQAHATTAAAAGEKPDMQLLKMAYDHVDKQMKESIKFKNYFESLSPEDKAQYIQALALQNKQIYTGIQSPGKAGAPAKFLGFET